MVRTPLLRQLLCTLNKCAETRLDECHSRRAAMRLGLGFAAITLTGPRAANAFNKDFGYNLKLQNARIGVLGAGLAGLTAAYELRLHGADVTVLEGSGRVGGRVRTLDKAFNTQIYIEEGGEFIDSNHESIRGLCKDLGLPLLDITKDNQSNQLIAQDYKIENNRYTELQIIKDFRLAAKTIARDLELFNDNSSDHAKRLDWTPLHQYVSDLPVSDWLAKLLINAYEAEFGMPSAQQSALNLITTIGTNLSDHFEVFGDSDERYKIEGGSSGLIAALAKRLEGRIQTHKKLIRLRVKGDMLITNFEDGSSRSWDRLILAIPFSCLRKVKLDIELSEAKKYCINQLQYGNSCKLILSTKSRPWREANSSGYLINDVIQNGWDSSQLQCQNKGPGAYTVFLGGQPAETLNRGGIREIQKFKEKAVKIIESAYPEGIGQVGDNHRFAPWVNNPWAGGSYPSYRLGQWTSIGGLEGKMEGNIHFAGDHTSEKFQGYMNGAVESGVRAAREVLGAIKQHS